MKGTPHGPECLDGSGRNEINRKDLYWSTKGLNLGNGDNNKKRLGDMTVSECKNETKRLVLGSSVRERNHNPCKK